MKTEGSAAPTWFVVMIGLTGASIFCWTITLLFF